MPKLTLAVATLLVAVLGLARPADAQPSPSPPPPIAPPSVEPEPAPAPASAPEPAPAPPPPASPAVQPTTTTTTIYGPPSQDPPSPTEPPPAAAGSRLSEGKALGFSLGGTALSWALVLVGAKADSRWLGLLGLVGTYLAPSVGHWYQGRRLTRGFGVRTAGVGLLVGVAFMLASCDECTAEVETTAKYLIVGGLIFYGIGTFDDIITAPLEVRKHNKRLEVVGVAPMVTDGGTGLSLAGRF